jgi:sugar/nucleoside kinase (ribokinase family)
MRAYDVLVLGDLNVDVVVRGVAVAPEFGQGEHLVDDASLTPGGSGAIFACGASRLGLRVALSSKVGDDELGRFLVRTLGERGVDTAAVVSAPGLKTGLTVHLVRDGDRAMLTYPGAIAAFTAADVSRELLGQARHVHASSVFLHSGLRPGLAGLLAAARAAGASTSLDPGWDPAGQWNGSLQQALRQVDFFFPNEQEALYVARADSLAAALDTLQQQTGCVVVKRGPRGAVARQGRAAVACAGFPVRVVDTVGAGDTFAAGFVCAHLRGHELAGCLRWGCAAGALSATQAGGLAGQPTAAALEAFLASSDQGR